MKSRTLIVISSALFFTTLFLFLSCDSTVGPDEVADIQQSEVGILANVNGTYGLIAGKNLNVGIVEVADDGDNLTVIFRTNADWCLKETHLHVSDDLNDIPTAGKKKKNPVPGRFDYSGTHDCLAMVKYSPISLERLDSPIYIAAHAVVAKTNSDKVLLGTQNNHPAANDDQMEAKIFAISSTGETSLISHLPAVVYGSETCNFNANGLDQEHNRFYFSNCDHYCMCPSDLFFYDLDDDQQVYAGKLQGSAAGAAVYKGVFYYIPSKSNELHKVTFDASGKIDEEIKIADVFSDQSKALAFGDIDIRNESGTDVLYGSASEMKNHKITGIVFFKMNLDGTGYHVIKKGGLFGAGRAQIAFGSDGVLYGANALQNVSSQQKPDFFSINCSNGDVTLIGSTDVPFSDLSTGPVRESTREETAWGEGTRFTERGNWGMYFTYNPGN